MDIKNSSGEDIPVLVSFRWKPILFSALVLPGVGQLWQRRWKTGSAILVLFSASAMYLIHQLTLWYQQILFSLETQNLPADPDRLLQWVTREVEQLGTTSGMEVAQWVLLVCWLGAILDAWWYEKHKSGTVQS